MRLSGSTDTTSTTANHLKSDGSAPSTTQNSTESFDHLYVWGNNELRARIKGKRCRVLARGGMNSVLIEFEDGFKTLTSRHSIRKEKNNYASAPEHLPGMSG